jgi:hypothetical protein
MRALYELDIHFVIFSLGERNPVGVLVGRRIVSNVEEVFPVAPILVGDIDWALGD